MPSQAGWGEAQIRATVTVKSSRGQVRKHYIWYGLLLDRARLNTQCSTDRSNWGGGEGGGKNRESEISLAQVTVNDNGEMLFVTPASRRLVRGHLALGCEASYPGSYDYQPYRGTLPSFARPGRVKDPSLHRHPCRALARPGRARTPVPPSFFVFLASRLVSRRTGRSTRSRGRNLGCGTSRWGRAGCRPEGRSPSSQMES